MKIGLTYDLKDDWQFADDDPVDANAEFDKPETVDLLIQALEDGGHQVVRIGHVQNLVAQIEQLDVDIVFNICEGVLGRNRESQVPVLLEMHGIPFVASDALTLGITLDKVIAKKCFIADQIPTPRYFVARDSENLKELNGIGFPLIVKTRYEGTSKGLTDQSLVNDFDGLKRQVDYVIQTYRQPALIEEFIAGSEFTVAVIGNDPPRAMPVVQVSIDGQVELGNRFYTYEMVCSNVLRYVCPALVPVTLTHILQELAVKAYLSVGCRDIGRVDFRVDRNGQPHVLEINPLPSFDKSDVFHLFPEVINLTFEHVINEVLNAALERYGIIGRSALDQHDFSEVTP